VPKFILEPTLFKNGEERRKHSTEILRESKVKRKGKKRRLIRRKKDLNQIRISWKGSGSNLMSLKYL